MPSCCHCSYETANGIKVEQSGNQKQITRDDAGHTAKGKYSFTSPEGVFFETTWVADENGFQASGDHLPVAPPMPEHVVKMLADLRARGLL